jgi:hypothetical protein
MKIESSFVLGHNGCNHHQQHSVHNGGIGIIQTNGDVGQSVECVVCNDEAPGSKPGFSSFIARVAEAGCLVVSNEHATNSPWVSETQFHQKHTFYCPLRPCSLSLVITLNFLLVPPTQSSIQSSLVQYHVLTSDCQ